MVKQITFYLLENDHRLEEYCEEVGAHPNSLSLDQFISVAKEIGWIMSQKEYERLHNTNGLPKSYYLKIDIEKDVSTERTI